MALVGVALVSTILWSSDIAFWIFSGPWNWFIGLALLVGGVSFVANLITRWKWETGVEPNAEWIDSVLQRSGERHNRRYLLAQ